MIWFFVVSGCLKLLAPEELERLVFPQQRVSNIPIKKVVYITETDKTYGEGNFTKSQHGLDGTRFNLFTGYQTLDQRDQSFKVMSCISQLSLLWRRVLDGSR